ncbi:hypothetical protein N7509_009714 [Penicillium cosmopolitanum]|uniref:NACHT domain-containing protein n=1 Tax=Penicillium cosmopolitanum TaxID=1131564 RepID=A0A9W9VPY3_9EURO|nr:uncharacterized protein N7509_009714 [Penicillium cosmopolitanum]KAJ5387173.1 hypothetical protein N7509_009714 [Penicillium cosmopolitanum]
MSDLISRPGPSGGNPQAQDPTTALRRALVAFEDVLTEEQKQKFLASNDKPDIASVISFVAEVDANNSSTARRCVAPRLYSFLESTQQFTAIVDTFVSSNPQIAALVWGGVKFAILSASNISSYFEKVTSMIMEIGKTCPRYQQFGQLYPGCTGLQRELCEYYATIVRLCIKIVESCRRAPVSQILSSVFNPFESEFQPLLIQLEQTIKSVRLEISLAANQALEEMRKLVEHESHNSTSFRRLALKFHEKSEKENADANEWRLLRLKRENAKLRSAVKDNLSAFDFAKPWKQALRKRVPSTAEWLQQEPVFSHWRDSPQSSILWCPGKMGAGKTIMMSNVVAHLYSSRQPDDVISYCFCSVENSESLSARSVFGTIARQLLSSQIETENIQKLRELESMTQNLDTSQVIDLLLSYLGSGKQYFLVLDGVEEFESDELKDLTSGLATLCRSQNQTFKLICAGRFELENKLFNLNKLNLTIPITGQEVDTDIDRYISTILIRCLEEEQLKLGDPGLIIKISDALRDGSNGMFLWAHLTIQDLCAQQSDNDILAALETLPRSLQDIFDRRISRIRVQQRSDNALKALKYCGILKRPLAVMAYQELLSLSPYQKSLDRGSFPNDMDQVWSDCCGLVFVDEEEGTVHYVHQSVRKYLFNTVSSHLNGFNIESIDSRLGLLCMTYLDLSDFKRQLAKVLKSSNARLQPVQFGISSISHSRSTKNRIALKLLSNHRQIQNPSSQELGRNMERILHDFMSSSQTPEQENEFHFLEYAQAHWISHTSNKATFENPDMWALFRRCLKNADVVAHKPWSENSSRSLSKAEVITQQSHFTLLFYSCIGVPGRLEKEDLIQILRDCKLKDRFLFTNEILSEIKSDNLSDYALFYAAEAGCLGSIRRSLESKADVNIVVSGCSALQAALKGAHSAVVRELRLAGADVNSHWNQESCYT